MIHTVNIIIHVIAGLTAMIIAIVPYSTEKGGHTHKLYGRIFLWLMAIVIITALNGVLFFRDRPFLTVVTLLSFYTSYSGYRILKVKERGYALPDFIVMIIVLIISVQFIFNMETANIVWNKNIVRYLLIYTLMIVCFDMLRFIFPKLIQFKRFWIYDHVYKMTSSLTALVSAGVGTVLVSIEPYNQILPAVLGTLWLIFSLYYFPKQVKGIENVEI